MTDYEEQDKSIIGVSTAGPSMNRVGKILIANPSLPRQNPFHKSVIYIYQDNQQVGTQGVVLNKPTLNTVQQLCFDHEIMFPDDGPIVHLGGPVNPSAMVLLHTDDWYSQNTVSAGSGYCVSSDKTMFVKMATGNCPVYWRLCIGMSGWAVNQLEMEIQGNFPYTKAHQWLTAEANDAILFEYDGEEQWMKAMELSGQQMFDQYI